MTPKLSIIVPVLNEIDQLSCFITHLKNQWQQPQELLIVDGGSTDGTWEWLQKNSIPSYRSCKGRAQQMNFGALKATTDLLYFVHVDSKLPKHFDRILFEAYKRGITAACFQLEFDSQNFLLKSAAAGSRWNYLLCRGGDQSLMVLKSRFDALGGYDPRYKVCEDITLIKKLYKNGFFVLPEKIITSTRRFQKNGILRLLFHFGVLHLLHWFDTRPEYLCRYYDRMVR